MSWRIGLATGACVHRSILESLPAIAAAGAAGIEVSTPPRHFDVADVERAIALDRALGTTGLRAVSIHAPFGRHLDLADESPTCRHRAVSAVLSAAAAIKRLGGHVVVVHPSDLERATHDPDARLAAAATSLQTLAVECRREGVTLALESPLPHLIGGHPDEFGWLLAQVDGSVRVCLDTGHLRLGRHWQQFAAIAGERIAHVHAHDNHGHGDDHLPPGEGAVDWREVADTLRAIDFDGWVMLELTCLPGDMTSYFRNAIARTAALLG